MAKSRFPVTLLALVLSFATLPSAGLAADVCQNPTFRISQGSPFKLGSATQPEALAAGTYVARPGVQSGCGCDLVVALKSGPSQGFLARLRGNDDGTFTESLDARYELDRTPVAIATGRFRTDVPVDGIVAVTSTAGENGRVRVFVPDPAGGYTQSPTEGFATGPDPAAITTGDFNGDGLLDVAIINEGDSSLTILLGTGTGTFAPNPVTVANLGGHPESLTAGKFSGSSGADDIAIGAVQLVGGVRQVGIVIVPGSSTGQFAPKPIILVGQRNSFGPSIAAANLSGLPRGTLGRPWRDLAIAFTDRTGSGDAVGRVKVLLGRDGGGFGDVAAAQTLDIGATLPSSIKVADLDDDGVVDLVVSAFGQSPSLSDGTIHFFQGRAAPAANIGFQLNPSWFTIPANTGIRPRALVAARFGNHSPGQPIANMGLAAINAPDLDSVIVFQGNGQGSFVEPSLVTTVLADADHLFVSGDFHSVDGNDPLQDLAFITQASGRNVLRVLQANGAGGFALPDPGQPPLLAGNSPSLIAAGQFIANGPTGVAIVDTTGAAGQQPLLKIFFGQGNGVLTAGTELPLSQVGKLQAIATGHFRGPDMPLDIALAGETSPLTGRLTLLFNDGHGAFAPGTSLALAINPSALVPSNRLRPGGKTDLLIRDTYTNRFLFLVNIDNGAFRPAIGQNQGLFAGAGNSRALLVGNVAHAGSDARDDVVTYDRDMTLKIFVNNGLESFDRRTVALGTDPHFAGAQRPYLLADFGSGTLALAAPVVRGDQVGLLLLQGDGTGGFAPATGEVPLQRPLGAASINALTEISQSTGSSSGFIRQGIQVQQTFVGQFRSALHGNGKPDFALITMASAASRNGGNCPGDNRALPLPAPPPRPVVCPVPTSNPACHDPRSCVPPCCLCADLHVPQLVRCPNTCNTPFGPPVPFQAFCNTTITYTPTLAVFGNTCGD